MPSTKQDTISRVYEAALHILHNSELYGSEMWPKNGFVAGAGIEGVTKSDTIAVYVAINYYKLNDTYHQVTIFNIINEEACRAIDQAKALDLIMDYSTNDNVLFQCNNSHSQQYQYRFNPRDWDRRNTYYCQLAYTFTIND